MRTVVNLRTGGRTPPSGALHALVLLAVVLGVGGLARHIPHAVLAGILPKLGVDKRLPDSHHHVSRRDALRQAVAATAGQGDD